MTNPGNLVQNLHPDDLADLRRSGLSDATIAAMACKSAMAESIQTCTRVKVTSDGYSIPYQGFVDQEGNQYTRWRLRTVVGDMRYVGGSGDEPRLYVPRGFADLPPNDALLVITEGEKKAALAVQEGIHCVAVQGVWSWAAPGPRAAQTLAGEGVSADTLPLANLVTISQGFKRVLVLGDSDLISNPQARAGFERLVQALVKLNIRAAFGCCPPAIVRKDEAMTAEKQGLDDWIVAGGAQARRSLFAIFRAAELLKTPISDLYHAKEIALRFRDRFAFSRGVWWLWSKDTVIWMPSKGRQLAGILGDGYRADAQQLKSLAYSVGRLMGAKPDPELRVKVNPWLAGINRAIKQVEKAGKDIENVRGLEPALKMAEHLLTVPDSAWDSMEYLLAVQNGVIDLRTSDLLSPSPEYKVTRIAGVAYDPLAQAPKFHEFLERVQPDPTVRAFLQREAGYCAVGSSREQRLDVHHGSGANGKTTYVSILSAALGTYAAKGTCSLLAEQQGDARYDLAAVAGARMISISESSENLKLDEAMLKAMTGGDLQTCRHPYGEFFSFSPAFTLLLDTNHPLSPNEAGEAMKRRLRFIPWSVIIPTDERNKALPDDLKKEELPGILAWIVQGANMYLASGLTDPEIITKTTNEQLEAADSLSEWLERCCVLVPSERTQSSILYLSFKEWSNAEGNNYVIGTKNFSKRMIEKGFQHRKSNGAKFWLGVRLRNRPGLLGEVAADDYFESETSAAPSMPASATPTQPVASQARPTEVPTATELMQMMPGGSRLV